MISADPADGKMRLDPPRHDGDVHAQGTPVAKAAINATVDLKIVAGDATATASRVQLGKPDDSRRPCSTTSRTRRCLTDEDLATAVELCLDSQIASISALLGTIPLPAMPPAS